MKGLNPMRIHTGLVLTLIATPALVAQAPAASPTVGQKTAAARPELKRLNDACDFKGALALMEGILPAEKPAFDASSVRSVDISTKAYRDVCIAYFMAYQAADNMGQWEKGLDYLKKGLDLAKESVDKGQAKLIEARDDYRKMAGAFKELEDKNAEAIALLKAKQKLEDYEEGSMKIVKDWETRQTEANKWGDFFQYDMDMAAKQAADFQKYVTDYQAHIADQNHEIAKFALMREKKVKEKDVEAEIPGYQITAADKENWADGVLSSAAYMNSFQEKADKIAFVNRLAVLAPEDPRPQKALEDILAGKSGVQEAKAAKARKK
jgi:flagellar biosynthesis chaperone FliJ